MQTDLTDTVHSFTPPPRRMVLGMRQSALIEIVAALAALLLLDYVAFDHTRYWSVNPHPFWFIVLFIACKYGTKEALVAAVACSAALLLGNLPEQTANQDGYAYVLEVLALPLLWLISAVAFGELRHMHIRERDKLENALAASDEREQRIAQSYQWVKGLKDQLELRIAGQLRSSIGAYHAARAMESLTPDEVYKGLENLVSSLLYPEKFSVYTLNSNGSLDATLMHGWTQQDNYLRHYSPDSALYQSIIARRDVLCVVNADHEQILSGQAILAGPLTDRETGEIVGMLKIEKMDFADLHLSNIESFRIICEWTGVAIINARKYQDAKAGSIVNPDHNLFTYSYFQRHSDYIGALGKRLGFDVSMISIKLKNADRFDGNTRARIARAIAESLDETLRHIDLAFDHQHHGEYSVVLPATGRSSAQIVLDKIRNALNNRVTDIDRNADLALSIRMLYEKPAA